MQQQQQTSDDTVLPGAVRIMQGGEHLLFALLLLVGAVQALVRDIHPVLVVIVSLALIGCYLLATGVLLRRPVGARHAWLLLLTAVWVGAILVSATFAWIVFALFFLYLYEFPGRVAVPVVVVLAAVVIVTLLVRENGNPAATVIGPLVGAGVAVVIMRIYQDLIDENGERRAAVEALQAAQADLLATQDELARLQRASGVLQERERLAREIHDTLAQGFSSILLTARALRTEPEASADRGTDPRVEQIETLAGENLEETRRMVAALTPADLDRALLAEALGRLASRFEEQTGVAAELRSDGVPERLPTQYEAALLRVAQGALANVRAHAAASRVRISLSYLPDAVTLDVVDDGRGFDTDVLAREPGPDARSGFGLRSMVRRVGELGGRLTVESAPGEGSAIAATLPLPVPGAR